MVMQFISKYSSEYLPHKRQACDWSKVGDINLLFPIFHSKFFLSVMSQSGVSFIYKHNCNSIAILSWQDVNVFIQYLCSPPGPGDFSSLLFVIVFFNLSVVIVMFSCFAVPLSSLSSFLTTSPHHYVCLVVPIFHIRILHFPGFPVLCHYLYSPFPVSQTTSPGLSETSCLKHTALLLPLTFLVETMWPLHLPSVPWSLLLVLYLLSYIYFPADPWFIQYEVHQFIYSQCKCREIPLHWIYPVFYSFPPSWLLRFC